ncbi:MAG: insulinase family protein [Bryobacteraceae bacterium]|nr:insulinase family protein [Bryobacteraceae bacterium]
MARTPMACAILFPALLAAADPPKKPLISFTEHRLENGLRVILAEDHSAPTYSIALTYNVGSRDEKRGRTGFAHLFEHMMFQGSENVGKGEHFLLINSNGGMMNGSTNADRTNYYQTLPANQLDLGLFLEADRMRSLAVTAANFENQRATVKEERRQNYDNRAYGRTFEVLSETAYDNFAYKHSTIGSMADLDAATLEDAQKFFKQYYAPNNAVLTLVGDFSSTVALEKIKQQFGSIPKQPAPPEPDMAEPEQKEERRQTVTDPLARLTRIDMAWKIPAGNSPDYYALSVLGQVLSSGQSGRLYQRIVQEKELALMAAASPQERRGPGLFFASAMVRPGPDPENVEKAIYEEIETLKTEAVADWELEKVRMGVKRQAAGLQGSTLMRAMMLGQYAVYYNQPGLVNDRAALLTKVSKEDLQRVAKKYLTPENRTVVTTVPGRRAPAAGGSK